jgi:hypothetical protein
MASTYVNDLRLNEMATGDQSGSWGTVTNTNLELIGEAFSYGTEAITTNADTHTTTISDGATAPGRSMFLKYTGTLDSACTITIGPNTVNKMWFIENATTGSQDIIISQGSGANITIAAGQTKAVYSDGAGAGAAFVDAFAALDVGSLAIAGTLVTSTAAELNILDGVTATAAELNILDGVTATAAELNILDGVTATAAEINILDGVTASTAELNYNDITTLGTVQASKTVTADASGDVLFPDGDKAIFGAGSDLQIYHDGSNSYISDQGTGDLKVLTSGIALNNAANTENMITAVADGAVTLYHDNAAKIATSATGIDITGTAVTDGVTVDGTLSIEEVYELVTTQTSTTGTITFDTTAQGVEFYTVDQTANRTINFSNVNANLAIGQSVTGAILLTQGATAYYLNVYQVDGTGVTPKWQGGSAPTEGNASGIDSYSFTIIKTADATFTVLASISQFA